MKIFRALLSGASAALLSVSVQAGVVDRVVAVVNDEVITLSELTSAFEPYQARLAASYAGEERERALAETRLNLLIRMIDDLLMEQQSRKSGVVVGEAELAGAIKDLLAKRNISQDEFRKIMERERTSLESYRKGVRDQLLRMKLVQREVKSGVAVSDEEIGAYYRKYRGDYEGKEAFRIKQILLPLPKEADAAVREKHLAEAKAVHRRLLNGEAFERLSAQYSRGPAAASGGDIGFIEKGMLLPEVEEVALSLPLNEISGVIESTVGFHLIQVIDRRGAGIKSIESVREEIRDKLGQEKMEKKFEEWMEALRSRSHIEIKL